MMKNVLSISAEIKGIKYTPTLCSQLNLFKFEDIEKALQRSSSFLLTFNENKLAISHWVSPKRTRSYPYARVYDTLGFSGKKITIIPVIKDEGKGGDRDYIQWDTISLMSLLNVYVILAYYKDASLSEKKNKITNQRFDVSFIKNKIREILSYQSDALHWNLEQIDKIYEIAKKALENYEKISERLNVKMHSIKKAKERINEVFKEKENFKKISRELAKIAQWRESITLQPKEKIEGGKSILTIKNYLGGIYHFTVDETKIEGNKIYLIEAKHTGKKPIPSLDDIKDGLLHMILYTNLENVEVDRKVYIPIPVLKLTSALSIEKEKIMKEEVIEKLLIEAKENNFKIMVNKEFIN